MYSGHKKIWTPTEKIRTPTKKIWNFLYRIFLFKIMSFKLANNTKCNFKKLEA